MLQSRLIPNTLMMMAKEKNRRDEEATNGKVTAVVQEKDWETGPTAAHNIHKMQTNSVRGEVGVPQGKVGNGENASSPDNSMRAKSSEYDHLGRSRRE